jgi:hypothetical protein
MIFDALGGRDRARQDFCNLPIATSACRRTQAATLSPHFLVWNAELDDAWSRVGSFNTAFPVIAGVPAKDEACKQ